MMAGLLDDVTCRYFLNSNMELDLKHLHHDVAILRYSFGEKCGSEFRYFENLFFSFYPRTTNMFSEENLKIFL